MESARCFKCIPRGELKSVLIYLTCQWLESQSLPITAPTEYWKLDELVSPRVGSVLGVSISEGGVTPPTPAGTGIIGEAVHFESVPLSSLLASSGLLGYPATVGMSFTCWLRFNTFLAGGNLTNAYYSFGAGWMGVFPDATPNPNLRADIWLGPAPNHNFFSHGDVPLGSWNFCAITFNQVTKEGKFYVNGNAPLTAICAGSAPPAWPIGDVSFGTWDDMLVDEIGLWSNHVLTAAEVASLYRGGHGRTYPF